MFGGPCLCRSVNRKTNSDQKKVDNNRFAVENDSLANVIFKEIFTDEADSPKTSIPRSDIFGRHCILLDLIWIAAMLNSIILFVYVDIHSEMCFIAA